MERWRENAWICPFEDEWVYLWHIGFSKSRFWEPLLGKCFLICSELQQFYCILRTIWKGVTQSWTQLWENPIFESNFGKICIRLIWVENRGNFAMEVKIWERKATKDDVKKGQLRSVNPYVRPMTLFNPHLLPFWISSN